MMRRIPPLLFLLVALTLLVSAYTPPPVIVKGLAQLTWGAANADRAKLDVEQWYAWGLGACAAPATWANCTPMNRNWDVAAQTYCPPTLLLGNEPTNPEPAGHPITATLAASVTVSIEQECPGMRIVAANIHLNNRVTVDGDWNQDAAIAEAYQWLRDYLTAYQVKSGHAFTQTLGVHCYAQYAADCVARLKDLADLPFAGQFWLTEFGLYGDAPYTTGTELGKFLAALPLALPNRIERAYIWTNRGNWPFDLVSADGTLTEMGAVWAAWEPPTITQVWIPLLRNQH